MRGERRADLAGPEVVRQLPYQIASQTPTSIAGMFTGSAEAA
jgi:hypothetical protein